MNYGLRLPLGKAYPPVKNQLNARSKDLGSLLNHRQTEGTGQSGRLLPEVEALERVFRSFSNKELSARQLRMERAASELGHHFSVGEKTGEFPDLWRADLYPRLIAAAEWRAIEKGVLQRARAFSKYVKDIYSDRDILRERKIPFQLVLGDPAFYRQLHGVTREDPFLIGAVDLLRGEDGRWWVVENRFSVPEGIAFVIQNRRILSEVFPEVFRSVPVQPVTPFTARLMESFREASAREDPLLVMLQRGESTSSFFDELFLVRHMGILSAKPADLVVREDQVFLKTVHGLAPVDGLLRRVESTSLDPVCFTQQTYRGTPGIIHACRRGKVRMFNAPGAEVADNRSLLGYSDAIIRFYLGERSILPTVPTYHCFDPDHAELLREGGQGLALRTIHHPEILRYRFDRDGRTAGAPDPAELLSKHPEWVVGQRRIASSAVPFFGAPGFSAYPSVLRVFVLMGKHPMVLPGGLTRCVEPDSFGMPEDSPGLGMKDTWVAVPPAGAPVKGVHLEPELSPRVLPLSSRVAEAFYWAGRYLERARNGAHQIGFLESLRGTDIPSEQMPMYWPLWRGVAASMGCGTGGQWESFPEDSLALTFPLVTNRELPGSVMSALESARFNFKNNPDLVSPELWRVLNRLFLEVSVNEKAGGASLGGLVGICQVITDTYSRILGVMERDMLHDEAQLFFRLGLNLERIMGTASILSVVLPEAVPRQFRHFEDDTDLTALLRLLGCLDAFRREYRSRAYLDRVVRLIWMGRQTPASFQFNLARLHEGVVRMGGAGEKGAFSELVEALEDLLSHVEALPLAEVFPARAIDLDRGGSEEEIPFGETLRQMRSELEYLVSGFSEVHRMIDATFFSHSLEIRKFSHPGATESILSAKVSR